MVEDDLQSLRFEISDFDVSYFMYFFKSFEKMENTYNLLC